MDEQKWAADTAMHHYEEEEEELTEAEKWRRKWLRQIKKGAAAFIKSLADRARSIAETALSKAGRIFGRGCDYTVSWVRARRFRAACCALVKGPLWESR